VYSIQTWYVIYSQCPVGRTAGISYSASSRVSLEALTAAHAMQSVVESRYHVSVIKRPSIDHAVSNVNTSLSLKAPRIKKNRL